MTNVVLNGNAYSDDGTSSRDMQGGGHRQWLLPMLGDATVAVNAPVQGVLDAAEAADGSAIAAGLSASAAAASATNALNSYNAANAIGSGWTAVTQAVVDGVRTVLQVTDWTGGKGTKPATGYVGSSGLVATAALATNIRGAVAYADLTGKPTLGTAAPMNVPAAAGTAATAAQVVRGDDPRLATAATRGTQLYTTSQSIAKSTFGTATYVLVELWGGSGSGAANCVISATISSGSGGGSGGEYVQALLQVSDFNATTLLTIGSGGSAVSASVGNVLTPGTDGGNTTLGALATAYGGLGGPAAFNTGAENLLLAGCNGGAGGGSTSGSGLPRLRSVPGNARGSIYGGGGGGGSFVKDSMTTLNGGVSIFGGNGGAGASDPIANVTAVSGTAPAGAGGGATAGSSKVATSGAGARGQARLTWW